MKGGPSGGYMEARAEAKKGGFGGPGFTGAGEWTSGEGSCVGTEGHSFGAEAAYTAVGNERQQARGYRAMRETSRASLAAH